jgi:hypothetical protein
MAIVTGKNAVRSFSARKKLSYPNCFGESIFGWSKYGHYNELAGIYQRRNGKKGKITVREKFYWPANPRTGFQEVNRFKYAEAISVWQAMRDEEKLPYRKRAVNLNFSGFNLFIKEFIKNYNSNGANYGVAIYGIDRY